VLPRAREWKIILATSGQQVGDRLQRLNDAIAQTGRFAMAAALTIVLTPTLHPCVSTPFAATSAIAGSCTTEALR